MEKKNKTKPFLSVVLAGILWGIISIFVKKLSAYGIDSLQISFIRMFIAAISFSLFALVKDRTLFKIRLKDIWIFICTGIVSITLFNTLYFYTMIHSQASVAVVLLYTSPIFVMVISAVAFKEKITVQKIVALVLTFGGCVLVAGVTGSAYKLTPIVLLSGIASGLFYALYSIFVNIGLKKYNTVTIMLWTFIMGFLGSAPFGKVGKTFLVFVHNPSLILFGVGIGLVSTVLPYLLYTWGLKNMETTKAAILVAVEPLVGCVIGMFLFHETKNLEKIIGIILILGSMILLNTNFLKKNLN